MNIIGIPALVGSYDNYIWVLTEDEQAWVVDPGESLQVIEYLQQHNLDLQGILITHFHHDHVEGIPALKQTFPKAHVYGSEKTDNPFIQTRLKQNDSVKLTSEWQLTVLETPGHTQDHIAYFNSQALFCGDTLFTAGCGRKFTGTFAEFTQSILNLRQLDPQTPFYCAHEYTHSNLKFAHLVEPDNAELNARIKQCDIHYPANHIGPQSTVGEECATNPFMRFDHPQIKSQLLQRGAQENAVSLFTTLRQWKDELDQSGELDQLDFAELQQQLDAN